MQTFNTNAAAASEVYETLAKQQRDKKAAVKESDKVTDEINQKMLEKLKLTPPKAAQTKESRTAKDEEKAVVGDQKQEVEELEDWLDDFLDE